MKKIIRLTESQIIKLIKNVISESILPDLTYNQFEPIPGGKGYELKDMGTYIAYIGKNSMPPKKQKNNPKVEFIVKFFKKPENNKYKVEILAPDSDNNLFGTKMVNWVDEVIIEEFKKPENGGIDFGSGGKSSAETTYDENNVEAYHIVYNIESNEFETFKNTLTKWMSNYGF